MARKQKLWNTYIMADNKKIYLRKTMTTMEAYEWLKANCESDNGNYFMCGTQVFCECR